MNIPDTKIALDFLKWLRPEGPWGLVTFPEGATPRGTTTDNIEAARVFIEKHNGKSNLYYTVNRVRATALGKTKPKAEDIEYLEFLHCDLDPRADENLAEERLRLYELLTEKLPNDVPPPSIIVDSGNGYNALWRLAPSLLITDPEDAKLYSMNLESLLKADAVHNVDRVLRLPGTINIPTATKRAKGRVAVETEIVKTTGLTYSLESFEKAAVIRTAAAPTERGSGTVLLLPNCARVPIRELTELDKWGVPPRTKVIINHGHHPDEKKAADKDISASAWLLDVVCSLVRCQVPNGIILGIIMDRTWAISANVLSQANIDRYARRQVERAHMFVAKDANDPLDTILGPAPQLPGTVTPEAPPQGGAAEEPAPAPKGRPKGQGEFQTKENNVPFPNQYNIRLAIEKLGAELYYNEFSEKTIIAGLSGHGPVLQDRAVAELYLKIDQRFGFRAGKDYFWMVVDNMAARAPFHPVRDYLDGLVWDGQPRLDTWLHTYAQARDTPYTRAVGALPLLAAVRRVRQPGCKFDEMLTLRSRQGTGKSTALAALCPDPDWFTDDLPLNADTKVVIERLAGRWIIEAGELKGMKRGDVEGLKSFLSRQVDRARMAYARIPVEVKRQCVFIGTTNSAQFLRDTTGDRRFWPVVVGEFDLAGLRRDRDQIWAEAAHFEAAGDSIRLDPSLYPDATKAQEAHHIEDPFVEQLNSVLGEIEGKIRAVDVWTIVGVRPGNRTQDHNERLGQAMRNLGWERILLRFGHGPERCYVKGEGRARIHCYDDGHDNVSVDYGRKPF